MFPPLSGPPEGLDCKNVGYKLPGENRVLSTLAVVHVSSRIPLLQPAGFIKLLVKLFLARVTGLLWPTSIPSGKCTSLPQSDGKAPGDEELPCV